MKTLGIIVSALLVILILLGFGLQVFLTKGLTTALNQGVFPAVKGMYGLDMSITNASVNLFKGSAELDGFTVRNLKGYSRPYLLTFDKCLLDVEMLSLLKRNPVVIRTVEATGATLTVERNSQKQFNVKELTDALKPVESTQPPAEAPVRTTTTPRPEAAPAPAVESESQPVKPVPVHIRRIAIDTTVQYIDSGRNQEVTLNLRLNGSDLFTVPAKGQPSSLIVLRGSLAHDQDAFVTDLNAILEPLTDPQHPSFNATGSILDISADFLGDLLNKNDMKSSSFSITPSITCKAGQLNGSRIDLVLNDLYIYGADIGDTTLKLPLSGTLYRPVLDLTAALHSLFSEQSVKIGKAVAQRELQKQFGVGTNAAPRDMLIGGLTNNVKEIADRPALQELIQQVVPGSPSATNETTSTTNKTLGESVGDALSEQLGKSVKELEGNEAVRESLRNLGKSLFGK